MFTKEGQATKPWLHFVIRALCTSINSEHDNSDGHAHSTSVSVQTEKNEISATPEAHDHSKHANTEDVFRKTVNWMGRFHPLAVHFPIALIVTAMLDGQTRNLAERRGLCY